MIPLHDLIASFRSRDSFAVVEQLSRETDALAAAKLFGEAANHLYWNDKDLAASVAMGRAGVQHALCAAATHSDNAPLPLELRGHAKAMAYNIASFTWPGWDEPGIVIGPSDLVTGFDAAKANLRLAIELKKGPLPMSRAHWMLAAQELAAQKYDDATHDFAKGSEHADAAGEEADKHLCLGFEILSGILSGVLEPDALLKSTERLDEVKARLRTLKDGEMFAQQIVAAARVFANAKSPKPN